MVNRAGKPDNPLKGIDRIDRFMNKRENHMGGLDFAYNSNTFMKNKTNNANMNFRIHYIPKIGSDVYVVYNQLWDEEDDYRTISTTGMLKVDYLFRF